jgi:hypothetical protein
MPDRMHEEWVAWRTLCAELQYRQIDVNVDSTLVNAIKAWGDSLVELRVEQAMEAVNATIAKMREPIV